MFSDRFDAGQKLAEKIPLQRNPIVLAIPRGGVILGDVIAQKQGSILDVIISKKITPPGHSEYAIGAVMHDGTLYKGPRWEEFSDSPGFAYELKQKQDEVKRRLEEYRSNAKYFLENKSIILVDDGIATGSTVFAILNWIKKQKTKKIILVVPVIPPDTLKKIKPLVDTIFTLAVPDSFSAVGQFYDNFSQVSDVQVKNILKKYHN